MEKLDVSIEELDSLKRILTITIPKTEVINAYNNVIGSMKDKVKVSGFRPGKVPKVILEKRYQKYLQEEALEKLIPQYYQQAVREQEIKPAIQPEFNQPEVDKTKPLVFTAAIEIWPDFTLPEFTDFTLEKQEIVITDEEVAEQRKKHIERATTYEVADKTAEDTDQVVIDFQGKSEENTTTEDKDFPYIMGSNKFLPEIEQALWGMRAGEEKDFDLTLPMDVQNEKFRGKKTTFHVKVKEVKEKQLPEMDDSFFENFGPEVKTVEDFDKFTRDEVQFLKEHEFKTKNREIIKDQLSVLLGFDLPPTLLDGERDFQKEQLEKKPENKEKDKDELEALAIREAASNLRFYVFVDRMLERDKLEIDEQDVYKRFQFNAQMMGVNPSELFQQDQGKRFMQETHQIIKEETVLDHIIEQVMEP